MINKQKNPVEWALWMYELEETKDHLSNLIEELHLNEGFDETDFKIQIGHIYAHLNRIYNSRNHIGEISEEKFEKYSILPVDIEPIG